MKKVLLLSVSCLFLFALAAQAQVENLPPNPVPGKCYVKCVTKDTFKTITETIEVAPAYKTLKVIPATYKTVEERVMIKEASKRLIYVPAVYETVEVSYVAREARQDFAIVPASFAPGVKTLEVFPPTAGWKYTLLADCPSVNKEDCVVVCYVQMPAKTQDFEITTLLKDAVSTSTSVGEATSTYRKQVVAQAARVDEIEVAAEYAMIERQVIDVPARVEEVVVPAKMREISRQILDQKGGLTVWEEVDCNLVGTYTVLPILWDYDSAVMTAESRTIIDENLLRLLMDKPNISIEIASHTDSRGEDDYNMTLSQQRAQSVVNYLVGRGISATRLVARGYGETRLKNRCANGVECTEAEHQVNRRTEFRILD